MLKNICRVSLISLTAIYVAGPFHSSDVLLWTVFNALVILVFAAPLMGGTFRRSAIAFFLTGLILLLYTGQPIREWAAGVISMLNIVAILVVMQLFSIPIQVGKYSAALEVLLTQQFNKEITLFLFVTLSTNMFASFLLFGTIPIMLSLFGDILQRNTSNYKRFAATALSRGYSLVVLWTPGGVNILLVLQTTGAAWVDVFLPGLALTIIGVLLSFLIERRHLSTPRAMPSDTNILPIHGLTLKDAWLKLADILAVVAGLIILIFLFEILGFASSTTRILFSGLIVASLWLLRLHKQPGFAAAFADYWNEGLLKTLDLAALFICMGIFSKGVTLSGILYFTQPYLLLAVTHIGYSYLLAGVPLMIVMGALIGLHPFVSMVILGQMMMSLDLSVPVIPLAMALSFGGAVSYTVSPFAGIVLTLARFLDCTPTDIAVRWNWVFSSSLLCVGILFIVLLNLIYL